jgi:zona occludens toxin (predicted ATPase)
VTAAVAASLWPGKKPKPVVPAIARAKEDLAALSVDDETIPAISRIVKQYLITAFRIPAPGATSPELMHWLTLYPGWDAQLRGDTAAFLDGCDVEVFSPVPPAANHAKIEEALALISRIEERRLNPQPRMIPT